MPYIEFLAKDLYDENRLGYVLFLISNFVLASGLTYSTKPEFNSNDKALLCFGYTRAQCDEMNYQLVAAGGSTDGHFTYEVRYSIGGHICGARFVKVLDPGKGWIEQSLGVYTGLGCSTN